MVYRIFVEKKEGLAHEASSLYNELVNLLGIKNLTGVRILNRYDAENITEELFKESVNTVFSEPQLDFATETPDFSNGTVFAVEYLPGQFDQRADSAAQCIQIASCGERPIIRSAKVYVLSGELTDRDIDAIKKYVINPVEAREASLEKPQTLVMAYDIPESVVTLDGFIDLDKDGLNSFIKEYGLAMDSDDIAFCQAYFKKVKRSEC